MKRNNWLSIFIGLCLGTASIFLTIYFKQERKNRFKNSVSGSIYKKEERSWVRNSFYGLTFESPNVGLRKENEINDFELVGVKAAKANFLESENIYYSVLFLDLESNQYDFEKGIQGILRNLVSEMNGTDLQYKFKMSEDWIQFGTAEGSFNLNSETVSLKAFLSFNDVGNHNNLRSLVIFGASTDQNINLMNYSLGSIELDSIKSEKNFLRWNYVKGKLPDKLINQPDSSTVAEGKAKVKKLMEWGKKDGYFQNK